MITNRKEILQLTEGKWLVGMIIVLIVIAFCAWLVREEIRYHHTRTRTAVSAVDDEVERLRKDLKELEKKLLWWEYKE